MERVKGCNPMRKHYLLGALLLVSLNATVNGSAPNGQEAGASKQAKASPELAEASHLSQQVVALYRQSKFDEALPLAKRALEIRENNWVVITNLGGLADRCQFILREEAIY